MNANARLKSVLMPHLQKVMSVVKSPRLEPRRTKRIGFWQRKSRRLKARCVIVTLSLNARGGHENSAAPEILCCKNNAAFEKVT